MKEKTKIRVTYEQLSGNPLTDADHKAIQAMLTEEYKGKVVLTREKLVDCCDRHIIIVVRLNTDTIADNGTIIGMATLSSYPKLSGAHAWVEDVLVLKEYRGKGIGKGLMQKVVWFAKTMKLSPKLDLTSRRDKTGARHLYRGLGFVRRNSDLFRLILEESGSNDQGGS